MLRRSAFLLYGGVSGDKGHMTLQQACTIFGFEMNQEWSEQDVKKTFRKLALKYHPDNGGTKEQFQLLKEAHKIVTTHRHDKGARARAGREGEDGEAGGIHFHRVNYDQMTNTIHRQTSDRPEYRSFGLADFAFFFLFIGGCFTYYCYNAWKTQMHVVRSRWSYSKDDMDETKYDKSIKWHPWRADADTAEQMDRVALIQGSIRREVVEERQKQTPRVYTPWNSGGPLARHTVQQRYGDDTDNAGGDGTATSSSSRNPAPA